MIRIIKTENVRQHELSDRAVKCPNALDHDSMSPYGVKARTGDWITFNEPQPGDVFNHNRCGRVLGRVDAPYVPDDKYPCERISGWISVLALADNMQHAYIRWIDPNNVIEVSSTPPAKLLAFITGELPNAEIVHKLSAYGTISEQFIDKAAHHIEAFKHGVSPAAYDCGMRRNTEENS